MDAARRLTLAREVARAGGDLAREAFRGDFAVETKDGPLDHVTETDRAVQRAVATRLREAEPDAVVVAEEDVPGVDVAATVPDEGPAWIVDPVDGTTNFAAGSRTWAVSVAAVVDGDPVAAVNHLPALGDTYAAGPRGGEPATRNGDPIAVGDTSDPSTFTTNPIFGVGRDDRRRLAQFVATIAETFGDVRRYGSAQYVLSAVAAGELDAAVSDVRLNPWDSIAGVHLVRRAGGRVTDVHGERWTAGSAGLIATNGRAHDEVVAAFEPR